MRRSRRASWTVAALVVSAGLACTEKPAPPATPETLPKKTQAPAAPAAGASSFGLTAPEQKTVEVAGKTLTFVERRYEPAFRLTRAALPSASELHTPEQALVRFAHFVTRGDWASARLLYDANSRVAFEADLAARSITVEQWAEVMKTRMGGIDLDAYRRRDLDDYVLIYSEPAGQGATARQSSPPMVLKADPDGRWWLSHELKGHPVMKLTTAAEPAPPRPAP